MRNFILGTDWSSDCDDAIAIRLLCRAHKEGKINLLGINIDDNIPESVRSLGAFLQTEGCAAIPIGFDRTAKNVCKHPRYQKRLCLLPSPYNSNDQAEPSVSFLRRLLTQSKEAVEIIEIGFTQSLAALLKSKPDDISPLSGKELVRQKVKKLWIMAGKWDEQGGKEHNFCHTRATRRGGAYLCKHWNTPITFLGWEISAGVLIGSGLSENDVLRNIIVDYGCDPDYGRDGWDPMLTQLALIGNEEEAGYSFIEGKAKLSPLTGKNYFIKGEGNHRFVIKNKPNIYYISQINSMIN